MNVLVVDNNEDILFLVQTILEMEKIPAKAVNNGFDAVKLCAEESFNIILLDLMMEGKDGFETCAEIRQTKLNKKSHIIALTAKAYDKDREEVLQNNFDDHFPKPFRANELIERLKSVKS